MADAVPAIDPDTLEPVADDYDEADSRPLDGDAYRAGVLAAIIEAGG